MTNYLPQLRSGAETAFIDASNKSNLAYTPTFVSNDYRNGVKVLGTIDEELRGCESFIISVAFITPSGITPLLLTLRELERRGIEGKILTTDYNMFTDPRALDRLADFKNIDLRMYHEQSISSSLVSEDLYSDSQVDTEKIGFHTKGYIFQKQKDVFTMIIGSSNMTGKALSVNKEWNTKLITTSEGEMYQNVIHEFEKLWNDERHTKKYIDFIEEYKLRYEVIKKQRRIALESSRSVNAENNQFSNTNQNTPISLEQYRLEPNKMQVGFIHNLQKLIQTGEDKALLISSTGTGKTYASAFGIRDALKPEGKVLFIVHRKRILKQAMNSFQTVFGRSKKMAFLTGEDKDMNSVGSSDFVFAMINMISKKNILTVFQRNEFDVIVFDEVHHAAASMYQKVLSYFEPKFLLGMTATPDRTDGENIYEIFDHNIAYEIRLQQALENNLLCPFHYFGITDITIDGTDISDDVIKRASEGDFTLFNMLTSDERVEYIIHQTKFYGYSGDRVKGLMFCSTIREAERLSEKLNQKGLRTFALSGSNSEEEREDVIERLVSDDRKDYLDYILTVNIFNEGVDIPEINQVVMLRPTESSIVFVQQLGRGLRKHESKEYVVVIDFIGNYNNNFLIPIALSGDRTRNKDNLRKYMMEGTNVIPGISTVHFDEISKKHIFESIDASSTPLSMLKEKYYNLKYKLGKVPTIVDFYQFGEIDPILFMDYQKGSYDKFVRRIDKDSNLPEFNSWQSATLDFVSLNLANGKRIHELLILQLLLEKKELDWEDIRESLQSHQVTVRDEDIRSALLVLKKEFINTQSEKTKYKEVNLLNNYLRDVEFQMRDHIEQDSVSIFHSYLFGLHSTLEESFANELRRIVEYGILRYYDYYSEADEDNLVLYQKYSRKDVCRILNWERDDSATIYGYRIKHGTCPIFVTYEKKEDISESTKYEDQFVDHSTFSWMTRSNVRMDSREAQDIIHAEENGLRIYLFIKKSDGEGTDFYYCGKVVPESWRETTIQDDKGNTRPIMNFLMRMDHSVRNDIYEYFTK